MFINRLLLLFTTLFFPTLVFAGILFESPETDQSIYHLSTLFGTVGNVLKAPPGNDSVMPDFFRIFNIALLSFGVLVATYSTIMTSIASGQEGEPMARKWGGASLPMRTVIGLGMLFPSQGGYCLAQVVMIWIITQGVGAANELWSIVLRNYQAGYSITTPAEFLQLEESTRALWDAAVCTAMANERPSDFDLGATDVVGIYRPINHNNKLYIGALGHGTKSHICGTITVPGLGSLSNTSNRFNNTQKQEFLDLQRDAFVQAFRLLEPAAQEAARFSRGKRSGVTYWTEEQIISHAKLTLQGYYEQIRQLDYVTSDATRDYVAEESRKNGWMYAGAFYVQLTGNNASVTANLNKIPIPALDTETQPIPTDNIPPSAREAYKKRAEKYHEFVENGSISDPRLREALKTSGSREGLPFLAEALFGPIFKKTTNFFFNFLSQNAKNTSYSADEDGANAGTIQADPLASLNSAGMTILVIVETAYVVGLIVSVPIIAASYVGAGQNPAGFPISVIVKLILPMITFMMAMLFSGAITFGLYLPMVPYLLFTFGVISWFILVFEAMAAAPLVALGLAAPGDKFGKSAHAIMLSLNIFLRPPLMVIGFIAAARMLIAIFDLFNYSFSATVASQVGNLGIFGVCAFIVIYAGFCSIIVNEVFTLIHILPDKTIRWIGGVAENTLSRAMEMESGTRDMQRKGTAQASSLATGAGKWLAKKGKDAMEGPNDSGSTTAKEDGHDDGPRDDGSANAPSEPPAESDSSETQSEPPANGLADDHETRSEPPANGLADDDRS